MVRELGAKPYFFQTDYVLSALHLSSKNLLNLIYLLFFKLRNKVSMHKLIYYCFLVLGRAVGSPMTRSRTEDMVKLIWILMLDFWIFICICNIFFVNYIWLVIILQRLDSVQFLLGRLDLFLIRFQLFCLILSQDHCKNQD